MFFSSFREHEMILPSAVDLEVALRLTFEPKSSLLGNPKACTIRRNDVGLNPVKSEAFRLGREREV